MISLVRKAVRTRVVRGGIALVVAVTVVVVPSSRQVHSARAAAGVNWSITGATQAKSSVGYWLAGANGEVYPIDGAKSFGDLGTVKINQPIVGIDSTPTGTGYWLTAKDGGVFSFGDAGFYGSAGSLQLNAPIVGIAATPSGKGYWLAASDGGVFTYGDAKFFGSAATVRLNSPVKAIAATPSGNGYLLAAADGGVFAFGDGRFLGSMATSKLNAPVVSMQSTPTGNGYLLLASDGGTFTFGDAKFVGSAAGGEVGTASSLVLRKAGGYQIVGTYGRVLLLDAVGARTPQVAVTPPAPALGGAGFIGNSRPFSDSSPFNTPTPTNTSWFDTPSLHKISPALNGDSFKHWYVNNPFGIFYGTDADPIWTLNLPDYIATDWNRNRHATTFKVHAPASIAAGTDTDHVLFLVNGTTYYELWNAVVDSTHRTITNGAGSPGWATGDIVNGPGAGTLSNNDGTRAANFSWAAGLITGHDLSTGSIDHALAVALPMDMLDGISQKSFIFPATGWDNGGAHGPIKIGSKIGIPVGTAQPAGLTSIGVMTFNSLKSYGAYVGDFVGGAWPAFYIDNNTVDMKDVYPLYTYWGSNGSADMEKIGPLLRIANYQP